MKKSILAVTCWASISFGRRLSDLHERGRRSHRSAVDAAADPGASISSFRSFVEVDRPPERANTTVSSLSACAKLFLACNPTAASSTHPSIYRSAHLVDDSAFGSLEGVGSSQHTSSIDAPTNFKQQDAFVEIPLCDLRGGASPQGETGSEMDEHDYDYDLFVVGGGSGGLAAAKEAADLGAMVAVADFVKPSPAGTTWGLGGTCVNVGCIPKKLMHFAALFHDAQEDAAGLGWKTSSTHNWEEMVDKVSKHILSLNTGAEEDLWSKRVRYYNAFASFTDAHTLELDDGKGNVEEVTAKHILVACGGRPNLGGYPGAEECCISSDDIFWRKKPPGKTLVVGASYIALELAGIIASFGFDTTVMVRSIFLRGFDQEMAGLVAEHMEKRGVKFARKMVPERFEKTENGQVRVFVEGEEYGVFDTVLLAIGRTGCAGDLNVQAAGLKASKRGKLVCNQADQTKVPNIFAIGDVVEGKPELTPVAIQSGRLLVRRLFAGSKKLMDYQDIATTVFTPLEFASIGYSEEDARKNCKTCKVYHTRAQPLEWNTNPERRAFEDTGYIKVIVDEAKDEKVIGVQILGANAGEVAQGLGVAMKCGFTKQHLDDCVGIHPTFAEALTTMKSVKGVDDTSAPTAAGC